MSTTRGQASVVGVAPLLDVGVVVIGLLTANADGLVDAQIASVDADAAADGFSSFRDGAVAATNDSYPVRVTDDDLSRVNRTIRITSETRPTRTYDANGYVANLGNHRVVFVGGTIVCGTDNSATLVMSVSVAFADDAVFPTVLVLTADATDGGGLGSGAALRTQTTRTVTNHPTDRYAVTVKAVTPDAWERAFGRRGFSATRTDFNGDGTGSVATTVPDERTLTAARCDVSMVIDRG